MKVLRKLISFFHLTLVANLSVQAATLIMTIGILGSIANAQDRLEEIVVVGTKSVEGTAVQEAPYSITALTGDYIEVAVSVEVAVHEPRRRVAEIVLDTRLGRVEDGCRDTRSEALFYCGIGGRAEDGLICGEAVAVNHAALLPRVRARRDA